MSERAEVEVIVPVDRVPTRAENRELIQLALGEAKRLVGQYGGQVLGMRSVARGQTLLGQLALKVRFAVLVPETATERPILVTVDRKLEEKRDA